MGYLNGRTQVDGNILFEGSDIVNMAPPELRELRGDRIAMVYQDPVTSLNPSMRVGPQVEEVLRENLAMDPTQTDETLKAHTYLGTF